MRMKYLSEEQLMELSLNELLDICYSLDFKHETVKAASQELKRRGYYD